MAAGGIRPRAVLPVVLDVGTNNEALLNDPLYLGMGHPRLDGDEYYAFVDEWVTAILTRWPNRDRITCFNDDIQSTSAITLAGLLASLKARGLDPSALANERIVCVGAGSAGIGVCEGIVDCIVAQGKVKTREEAYRQVWMLDQHGLLGNSAIAAGDPTRIVQGPERPKYSLDERQLRYVKRDMADRLSLEQVVEQVKPTILLGLTGIPGVFTEKAVRTMAQYQEKPVIFPLSNPDSHAECTAEQAFKWTDGRAIFASGSPFMDVTLPNGRIGRTNQCNNSYSFPGLGLGVVTSKASRVTSEMFLETARAIADMATPSQLKEGILYPGVTHLREVSRKVATRVCEVAFEQGVAQARLREGELLEDIVANSMYDPQYVPLVHQA